MKNPFQAGVHHKLSREDFNLLAMLSGRNVSVFTGEAGHCVSRLVTNANSSPHNEQNSLFQPKNGVSCSKP